MQRMNTKCCFPGHLKHKKAKFYTIHEDNLICFEGTRYKAESLPKGAYICEAGLRQGISSGLLVPSEVRFSAILPLEEFTDSTWSVLQEHTEGRTVDIQVGDSRSEMDCSESPTAASPSPSQDLRIEEIGQLESSQSLSPVSLECSQGATESQRVSQKSAVRPDSPEKATAKPGRRRQVSFSNLSPPTKRSRIQEVIESMAKIIQTGDANELAQLSHSVTEKLAPSGQSGKSNFQSPNVEQLQKEQPVAFQLLRNINTLFSEQIPSYCYFKGTLVGSLFQEVNSTLVYEFMSDHVSDPAQIRKYRSQVNNGTASELPAKRYNPKCAPRQAVVSVSEEHKILDFLKEKCPTPSGSKVEKFIQLKGRLELYADYVKWCAQHNFHPWSYPVFHQFLLKYNVRQLSGWYGHFNCPHCYKLEKDLQKKIEKVQKAGSKKEKKAAEKEHYEWKKHQFLKPHQRQVYERRLQSLGPIDKSGQVLIVVDFTCLEPESRENIRIQNMILVVVYHDKSNQQQRVYFDFLCGNPDSRKNDFFFVRRAFELFLNEILKDPPVPELRHIKSVQIWSDGGRKHFKNRFTMTEVPNLFRRANIQVSWSFFAPYHGANICDSHAGIEAQSNKRLTSQDRPNLTAEMFGASYASLAHTYPVVLRSIPRFDFDCTELKGISDYYHFEFPGISNCTSSNLHLPQRSALVS